jgi:Uma2 family endonuclease
MGDALKKTSYYTVEEYENLVQHAKPGERYEYADGQIIVLSEYTSNAHNAIIGNMYLLLRNHFRPKNCQVYTENVRLIIEGLQSHRLPDVMVTCAEIDKKAQDSVREPVLVVEVLSPATAMSDLGEKVSEYKKILSLQAYLIISQTKVWVRVYSRDEKSNQWLPENDYMHLSDTIQLNSLTLKMRLADIYEMVL